MTKQVLSTTQALIATRALHRLRNGLNARTKARQHLNRAMRQIQKAAGTLAELRLEITSQCNRENKSQEKT